MLIVVMVLWVFVAAAFGYLAYQRGYGKGWDVGFKVAKGIYGGIDD